jgi:hypothetical protein
MILPVAAHKRMQPEGWTYQPHLALRGLRIFCHFLRLARRRSPIKERLLLAACGRSHRKIAPVLTGCLACRLSKSTGEISLTGKIERKRDLNQGPIVRCQQRLGAFKPPSADITMR